jgi:hypothetical protein
MFTSSLRALTILDSALGTVSRLSTSCAARQLSYFDVAFNMTDEMFGGIYFGKVRHPPDLHCVLNRAGQANVTHMLATPGSLSQLKETLIIAKAHPNIFVTAGVHPTRCNDFESNGSSAEEYLAELKALIQSNDSKIVAGNNRASTIVACVMRVMRVMRVMLVMRERCCSDVSLNLLSSW